MVRVARGTGAAKGALLNAAQLASSLAVHVRTLSRYIDLLVDLLLVRRLPPWFGNVGKRLVRSPRLYLRDSGIVHALLGLRRLEDVLSHPVAGGSWEGFVLENLLAAAPAWTQPFFYRTQAGAEVDLVLEFDPGSRLEALAGGLQGFHSIRINEQWRIVFVWNDGGAERVQIIDYHR